MTQLPDHIAAELQRLIGEGLTAEQIAYMMRLDRALVDAAISTAKETARAKGGLSDRARR